MADKEITYNCTVAKMAEQLNIPLWKAMEMGKYFRACYREKIKRVEIEEIIKKHSHNQCVRMSSWKDLANAILKEIDKELK